MGCKDCEKKAAKRNKKITKQENKCTLPAGKGCYWRVEGKCILSDNCCEYKQQESQPEQRQQKEGR
jgi:hypothetical protein